MAGGDDAGDRSPPGASHRQVELVASVPSGHEDIVAAEIRAKMGTWIRHLRKQQGSVAFAVDLAAAEAPSWEALAEALAQLRTVHFLQVLLAHGALAASAGLERIIEIAAGAQPEVIAAATHLWRAFGQSRIAAAGALSFRVLGKRGGRHSFSSDEAKRAAAMGLVQGAAGLAGWARMEPGVPCDLECVAVVHHRHFDLLLRLHEGSRLDEEFLAENKRALRAAERCTGRPTPAEEPSAAEATGGGGGEEFLDGIGEEWLRELCRVKREQAARQPSFLADVEAPDSLSPACAAVAPLLAMDLAEQRRLKAVEAGQVLLRSMRRLRKVWKGAGTAREGEKHSTKAVVAALEAITWPKCDSRWNVMPLGTSFIYAFTLGAVANYTLGLNVSKHTEKRVELTRRLTGFLRQHVPNFPCTSIQCNKDYTSRLHVDSNNHGPSYIIALGHFSGGGVWVWDPEGDVEIEVPEDVPGWPSCTRGARVRGRVLDAQNKWVSFDGNLPHMTMPFTGTRISLVYFTVRGWLARDWPELRDLGFSVPGEEYAVAGSAAPQTPQEDGAEECDEHCGAEDAGATLDQEDDVALPPWLEPQEDRPYGCTLWPMATSSEPACRNKVELHVGAARQGARVEVGFQVGSAGSDGTLAVSSPRDVPHVPAAFSEVAERFEAFLNGSSRIPEPRRRPPPKGRQQPPPPSGVWEALVLRGSQRTGEMLALVRCAGGAARAAGVDWEAELKDLQASLLADGAEVGGMALRSVLLADEDDRLEGGQRPQARILAGRDFVPERLFGLELRVSAASFFQVDTAAAEALFAAVARFCTAPLGDLLAAPAFEPAAPASEPSFGEGGEGEAPTVLDLCCGTGAIALCVARLCGPAAVRAARGIEICREAVLDAEANAAANGLEGLARFHCAPAESAIEGLLAREAEAAGAGGLVAVVDPPRGGLRPQVCEALRRCSAVRRVVFVSCNPSGRFTRFDYVVKKGSLLENLVVLCGPGGEAAGLPFEISAARPVDMFPNTPHLELVVVLTR